MSAIDTVAGAVTRPLLPWVLLGFSAAFAGGVGAGLYGGIQIAAARYAQAQLDVQKAYSDSLAAKNEALAQAVQRSNSVTADFLVRLDGMKVVNTTVNTKVVKEVEKLVYTDCKVPASGIDLLQGHVDEVNLRLLRREKK